MTGKDSSARARVRSHEGTEWTFGEFLERQQRLSGKSIQDVVKSAKISRANFYLLRGDKQRPTIATAVALISALGLRCEVPAFDAGFDRDLDFYDEDRHYTLEVDWTPEDRRKARDKYLSSSDLSVAAGAALGGLGLGGAAGAALGGAAGTVAFPVAGPLAAAAFLAARQVKKAREQQRIQQQSGSEPVVPVPAEQDLREDFKAAADDMKSEDLEALLAVMKALRDSNPD